MEKEHRIASGSAPTMEGGSNRIVAINVEGMTPPPDLPNSTHGQSDQEDSHEQVLSLFFLSVRRTSWNRNLR